MPAADPADAFAGAERDIEEACQRRLAGVRRLPRRLRYAALRDALDERRQALAALRQKKTAARASERRLLRKRRQSNDPRISPA